MVRSQVNFIDQTDTSFPFDQFDPQEMIDKMVEVAENDDGLYRNVCPRNMWTS